MPLTSYGHSVWGFLNQYVLLFTAPSMLTQWSAVGLATTVVTTETVTSTRHPKTLILTDQASVTGILGEKGPEARKQPPQNAGH